MTTADDPLRDQLAQSRRGQILDAAMDVFAAKGFHRATTREIAAAAGVAEGTIYNYFSSKDDLLIGLLLRLSEIADLAGRLSQALDSDPREFFVATFREHMVDAAAKHQLMQAVLPEILIDPELRRRFHDQFVAPMSAQIEQFVQAHIERGDVRPINAALATRAVQGMIFGLFILRILGDPTILNGWPDLPDTLASLLFDGLNPEPRNLTGPQSVV